MKFGVRVLPKKGFLDPQGRAVEGLLQKQHSGINHVHIGKWIEIDVADADPIQGYKKVEQIAQEVLINPMTETFEVEKLK